MLMPLSTIRNKFNIHPKGIIHIGACLGEEAHDYAVAGVKNVIWIEANPAIFTKLRENISIYPGHKAFSFAASDKDNEVKDLHVTNNIQSSSILPLAEHLQVYPHIKETQTIKVPCKTIDTFVKQEVINITEYDFVNLDIQGYELYALRGMKECLNSGYIKWIYTEVNYRELYKGCGLISDIEKFLLKYHFYRLDMADTTCGWGDALYCKS